MLWVSHQYGNEIYVTENCVLMVTAGQFRKAMSIPDKVSENNSFFFPFYFLDCCNNVCAMVNVHAKGQVATSGN